MTMKTDQRIRTVYNTSEEPLNIESIQHRLDVGVSVFERMVVEKLLTEIQALRAAGAARPQLSEPQVVVDMRRASTLADEADGPQEYAARLYALAAGAPADGAGPQEKEQHEEAETETTPVGERRVQQARDASLVPDVSEVDSGRGMVSLRETLNRWLRQSATDDFETNLDDYGKRALYGKCFAHFRRRRTAPGPPRTGDEVI